jgi:hypothetical protein
LNILIGADPELFVRNPNSGEFVSGYGLIQGDKQNPFRVNCGAVQVDGMALEFNIDPSSTGVEFVNNINSVREQLQNMVPGYELVAVPVADFSRDYLDNLPREATELGCNPDLNAWSNGSINPTPDASVSFRSGAGHIHIGWGKDYDIRSKNHLKDCISVVKQLDYYLGIPSLLWDDDNRRRSLYGKAGAFRVKSYGVEYRTLSNAWLNDQRLIMWVYSATRQAVDDLLNGKNMEEKYGDLARSIINENQTDWMTNHKIDIEVPNFLIKKAA